MSSNAGRDQVAPICLAMILSDAIWRDPGTGKRTILGTFSVIFVRELPAHQALMAVHCEMTDGYGETEIILRLVKADDEEENPIVESRGMVDFTDPRMIAEFDFHFGNAEFKEKGEYRFQLLGAGQLLMERRLLVVKVPEDLPDDLGDGDNNA